MTEAVEVALIVALPPTLAVVAGIVIDIVHHRKGDAKLDHIIVLTNSNLAQVKEQLAAALVKIERLEGLWR